MDIFTISPSLVCSVIGRKKHDLQERMSRTRGFRTLSIPNLLKSGLGLEPSAADDRADVRRRTSAPCHPAVKETPSVRMDYDQNGKQDFAEDQALFNKTNFSHSTAARPSISAPRFYLSRSPLDEYGQGVRKSSQSSVSSSMDMQGTSSECSDPETTSLSSGGSIKLVFSDNDDSEFTEDRHALNGKSNKTTATRASQLNLACPGYVLELNEHRSRKTGENSLYPRVLGLNESDKPTAGICAPSPARCPTNVGLFSARLFNKLSRAATSDDKLFSSLLNLTHVCHVYKGLLAVTDVLSGRISFVGRSGRVVSEFLAEARSEPWAACVTPSGYLAVTFRRQSCVTVWSGKGGLVREFGHGVLKCPTGIACDRRGRFVVTDDKSNLVALFSPSGGFLKYLTGPAERVRTNREVFFSDSEAEVKDRRGEGDERILSSPFEELSPFRVRKPAKGTFNIGNQAKHYGTSATAKNGTVLLEKQNGKETFDSLDNSRVNLCTESVVDGSLCLPYIFSQPRYVCTSPSGTIIVSDSGSHSLKIFDPDGHFLRAVGGFGSGDGQLKAPYGVCCDQHDNIFVADYYNDRVSVFALDGTFLQHVLTSSSSLYRPKSVAVRRAHNRKLYVAHGGLRSTEILMYRLLAKDTTKKSVTVKFDV